MVLPLAPRALVFSTLPSSPLDLHPYLSSLNELPPRSSNPLPQTLSQCLSQTLPQPTFMDFEPSFPYINLSRSRLSAQPEPFLSREQVLHQLIQYQGFDHHIEEAIQNAQQRAGSFQLHWPVPLLRWNRQEPGYSISRFCTFALAGSIEVVEPAEPGYREVLPSLAYEINQQGKLGAHEEADKDEGLHATSNIETEDSSVPKSSSPRSSQIQKLTNQVLILQSQKYKLELAKNIAKAEAALLKAQPSFPNSTQQRQTYLESFCSRYCIKKTEDASVPSAGQAGTQPAEGEKNTNQTAIS
ncbi:hypothetical protein Tco_1570648 [Tanacetum coccineum]